MKKITPSQTDLVELAEFMPVNTILQTFLSDILDFPSQSAERYLRIWLPWTACSPFFTCQSWYFPPALDPVLPWTSTLPALDSIGAMHHTKKPC